MQGADDDFSAWVGQEVKPLAQPARASLDKAKVDAQSAAARRQAAAQEPPAPLDPLAGEPIEWLDALAVLSFQRPGVQHGVFRNLRLGHYAPEARLDLHHLTLDRDRSEVYHFIKECLAADVRTALITHGKSEGRKTPALIKSALAYWLPQMDEVLAFHSAQKHHGGAGATYVLLRKSPHKKQQTREALRLR